MSEWYENNATAWQRTLTIGIGTLVLVAVGLAVLAGLALLVEPLTINRAWLIGATVVILVAGALLGWRRRRYRPKL